MDTNLTGLKRTYYTHLDSKARLIARELSEGKSVGLTLLHSIEELYRSARTQESFDEDTFRVRYHAPISSDLEFLVARVFHHYSNFGDMHWSVFLRCQRRKTAPDVRIEHNGKTLAIVEIKAKAGWIQSFLSRERAGKDLARLREGKSAFDPKDLIKRVRSQLQKYRETYDITPKQVFVLLPSLALVHRKRSKRTLKDYKNDFAKNSGLPKSNLILLSNNLRLDLSPVRKGKNYEPTRNFERLVQSLARRNKC